MAEGVQGCNRWERGRSRWQRQARSSTTPLGVRAGGFSGSIVMASLSGRSDELRSSYSFVEFSPNGTRAALTVNSAIESRRRHLDPRRARGLPMQLTSDREVDESPIWSPDGSRLVFSSNRKESYGLHQRASSSGAGREQRRAASPNSPKISDELVSRWPLRALFRSGSKTGPDLWALPLDGNRQPFVFLKTNYSELWGQFSPDGRWVAYQSDESGRHEIYVRAFPGPGGQSQVSTAGGVYPRWAAAGDELSYVGRIAS